MCPQDNVNGASPSPAKSEMVAVDGVSRPAANGVHTNGKPAAAAVQRNPYAPRYADFLSNISNFKIIESTLRGQC
jgi:homocitrate synthase